MKGVTRVGIVGLGLIGGSLGMALRREAVADNGAAMRPWYVMGHDLAPEVAERALAVGAIDEASPTLAGLAARADILVVAVPTSQVAPVVLEAARHIAPHTVVTDCGSVKQPIFNTLASELRQDVEFIGGHPMAGAERQGIEAVTSSLFTGVVWALVQAPGRQVSSEARRRVEDLVRAAGAVPVDVDASEHDRAVAFCSHMPYILSVALALACRTGSERAPALDILAARSFRDMTRVARAEPRSPLDYCMLNRAHLLEALDCLTESLAAARLALRAEDEGSIFSMASVARDFLAEVDRGSEAPLLAASPPATDPPGL